MAERRKNHPNLVSMVKQKAIGGDLQEGESQVRTQTSLNRKSIKIGKEYNMASQKMENFKIEDDVIRMREGRFSWQHYFK